MKITFLNYNRAHYSTEILFVLSQEMTLDSCLYVSRKGGAWGTEFHHLCRGTLNHSFAHFCFIIEVTFSVHFPTCSNQDSLCLLFVFVLIGMLEASKAIFAFKAVAVYSPPPVLMLWIPNLDMLALCVYVTLYANAALVQSHALKYNSTVVQVHVRDLNAT